MRTKIISLLKQFPRSKILDAGCGYGEWTKYFDDVVGIDTDRKRLKKARENGLKTIYMDLNRKLKFPYKHFDTVFCSNTLEHLDSPYKTLKEFNRILKDDGILILGIPNSNALVWDESEWPFHIYSWTDKTIKHLLRNTGFRVNKQYTNSIFKQKILTQLWNYIPFIKKHWIDLWYICRKETT